MGLEGTRVVLKADDGEGTIGMSAEEDGRSEDWTENSSEAFGTVGSEVNKSDSGGDDEALFAANRRVTLN